MPLTAPNTKYHTPSSYIGLMVDMIEALCGGVGSIPSTTLWTVIDSWDGTTREVPSGGLLANSTTAWAPGGGAPVSGSWIVLQSQPGLYAAVHQSKWTVSGTTANVQLIPYADWTPGGGSGAAPTLPTRITTTTSLNIGVGTTPRSLVWDEGMVAALGMYVAGVSIIGFYLGEIYPYASEVEDPRPFVHVGGGITSTGWQTASWVRYSPVDDTTLCSMSAPGSTLTGENNTEFPSYGASVNPVRLWTTTATNRAYAGVARHIGSMPRPHASSRTTWGLALGERDWVSVSLSTNIGSAIRHDGTTLDFDELRTPLAPDLDPPPAIDPVIDFITTGSIAANDDVIVDITDDLLTIATAFSADYTSGTKLIYSPIGFAEEYSTSTITPIAGGNRFTLKSSAGWYEDFTLNAYVSDNEGLEVTDSNALTVTGGSGYPELVLPSDPPVIAFTGPTTIIPTDSVTVSLTDDVELSSVAVWAEYVDLTELIYTSAGGFADNYNGTSSINVIGPAAWDLEIFSDSEWYDDVTVKVAVTDSNGQEVLDSEAYTVTGGAGIPGTAGPADVTAPVISNVEPASMSSLRRLDPVSFTVTDDSAVFLVIFVTVEFPDGTHELVYNAGFTKKYAAASSKTAVYGGSTFRLKRAGGWPATPTLWVTVYDRGNNPVRLSI